MDYSTYVQSEQDGLPGGGRDLTTLNKVQSRIRYLRIVNTVTGEYIETDTRTMRLNRMRRRIFSWAEVQKGRINDKNNVRMVMITLTYRGVEDWRKNHIRDYCKELKRRMGSRLLAYAWVAELQKRGAVHYHMIVIAKKGSNIPMPDRSGMWKHGLSRIETAKTPFYLVSYAKKDYQKEGIFPKGMRMFSVWLSDAWVDEVIKWKFRLSSLPRWLTDIILPMAEDMPTWKRAPGGGWFIGDKLHKSNFRVTVY